MSSCIRVRVRGLDLRVFGFRAYTKNIEFRSGVLSDFWARFHGVSLLTFAAYTTCIYLDLRVKSLGYCLDETRVRLLRIVAGKSKKIPVYNFGSPCLDYHLEKEPRPAQKKKKVCLRTPSQLKSPQP